MQDLLGLGSEARMNTPSTLGGNWCWRAEPDFATDELAARIHRQMELYHRLPARRAPKPAGSPEKNEKSEKNGGR